MSLSRLTRYIWKDNMPSECSNALQTRRTTTQRQLSMKREEPSRSTRRTSEGNMPSICSYSLVRAQKHNANETHFRMGQCGKGEKPFPFNKAHTSQRNMPSASSYSLVRTEKQNATETLFRVDKKRRQNRSLRKTTRKSLSRLTKHFFEGNLPLNSSYSLVRTWTQQNTPKGKVFCNFACTLGRTPVDGVGSTFHQHQCSSCPLGRGPQVTLPGLGSGQTLELGVSAVSVGHFVPP